MSWNDHYRGALSLGWDLMQGLNGMNYIYLLSFFSWPPQCWLLTQAVSPPHTPIKGRTVSFLIHSEHIKKKSTTFSSLRKVPKLTFIYPDLACHCETVEYYLEREGGRKGNI